MIARHLVIFLSTAVALGFAFIATTTHENFALAQQPDRAPDATRIMERFDSNKDGFIAREEAQGRMKEEFDAFDKDQDGQVSQDELRARLPGMQAKTKKKKASRRPGEVIAPAAREERQSETLNVGDTAPDFTLPLANGEGDVTLSELYRDKPVVLVFGSISCSPFRQQVAEVEKLYQQYGEQVHFVMVYIREAHPDSMIYVRDDAGAELLEKILQTDDVTQRTKHAQTCTRTLKLSFPMLVDGEDNRINKAYAGWPIRLVIVGTDGRIVDPGEQGPKGFSPEKVAHWLKSRS